MISTNTVMSISMLPRSVGKCSCDNGKRKIVAQVMQSNKTFKAAPPVWIDCFGCQPDQRGWLTPFTRREAVQADRLWCKCEDMPDAHYVDDGVSAVCHKHHWACNACGKIQQVG